MTDLDPKLTFDSFVVGPANRLASAAAKRAADAPGSSYNPLFLYSASGLGKSHILNAIAHHVQKHHPDRSVEYMALETYLGELEKALEEGDREVFKDRFATLDILLLDDVQFLTGQAEAQEMLLRTLDDLSARGSQIVLASDRPPADINGLDARLLSRFSGGLIVDIGPPEYETRVAIVRKKAEERNQELLPGVAEALGRYPFKNVRELGGALNKVFATQDLEGRQVTPDEVAQIVGEQAAASGAAGADEFDSFLKEIASTVAETVEEKEAPWRKAMREAVDAAEREGFSAKRLQGYLDGGSEPAGWEELVEAFKADIARLREIDHELDRLGNPWPEAAEGVLKDPDRLEEAEALLTSVRERQRPFPKLGPGKTLADLTDYPPLAVKAAEQLIAAERPEYNPIYVWASDAEVARTLLGAAGRAFQALRPDARMAVTSVAEFAEDFIRALGEGVAGAWRERWWTVDLLLVHGIEELARTERAEEEFFHLFEALKRRGSRVMLVSDRPPSALEGVDERLRSRFEGGLVLEIESGSAADSLELVQEAEAPPQKAGIAGELERAAAARKDEPRKPEPVAATPPPKGGAWFPSPENVVLTWPNLAELLIEELD